MRQKLKFGSLKGGIGADSWGTYGHPWPKMEVLELIRCLFSLLLFYRSPDVCCGCKWFTFAAENIKAVVAIYQFLLLYNEPTGLPSPWFSSNHHHQLYLFFDFLNLSSACKRLPNLLSEESRQYLKITLGKLLKPGVNGTCLCTLGSHPLV